MISLRIYIIKDNYTDFVDTDDKKDEMVRNDTSSFSDK
jgi:hypothetical protein